MDCINWNPSDTARWYAVCTRSRQEKVTAAMLETLGVSHFLPLVTQERHWSDRKKMILVPIFPGYLFVRIAAMSDVKLRVLTLPGVVSFVGNQNGPSAVSEHEIQNLRLLLSGCNECFPCPFLKAGDTVRIIRGPLAGLEGVFVRSGARSRVVVSVQTIQRSIAVDVAINDVEYVHAVSKRQGYSVIAPSAA